MTRSTAQTNAMPIADIEDVNDFAEIPMDAPIPARRDVPALYDPTYLAAFRAGDRTGTRYDR